MRKIFLTILLLSPLSLHAQALSTPSPYTSVAAAQQRLWDVSAKFNDAQLNLILMKLDLRKKELTDRLAQAQQAGDDVSAAKIQDALKDIDHRKDLEKQKHDLNDQILKARQDGDDGKADSLLFQLKALQ